MDGGRATSGAGALSGNLTGRVISACFALASFAVAILAGLASENPASRILGRALIAMMVCYPVGMLVGMVCERIIAAHIEAHRAAHPLSELAAHDRTGDRYSNTTGELNANDEPAIVV